MTNEKIENIAEKFKKEVSAAQLDDVKKQLTNVPDEKYSAAEAVKTKSSFLTVMLSAFLGLFGAGSFYLGCYKRGIVKVVFNVLVPLALGLVFLFWLSPLRRVYSDQAAEVSATLSSVNDAYTDFYDKQDKFSEYAEKLEDVYENIKDIQFNSDLNSFFNSILQLNNSTLTDLKLKISNALNALEGVGDNGENVSLLDKVDYVSHAIVFFSDKEFTDSFYIDINECLNEFINKFNALTHAAKLSDILAAEPKDIYTSLDNLSNEYVTRLSEKFKNITANLNYMSSAWKDVLLLDLGKLIDKLDDKIIKTELQTEKDKYETAKAELQNTKDAYEDSMLTYLNTEINDTTNVSTFLSSFKSKDDKIISSLEFTETCRSTMYKIIPILSKQAEIFFELINTSKKEVDDKLSLSTTLLEVCSVIDEVKIETDEGVVKEKIAGVSDRLTTLIDSSDKNAFKWDISSDYIKMLISFVLVLDGIIIISYWIGEVFKDRDKCYEINCERLKNSML